jgi:hypothetical protein
MIAGFRIDLFRSSLGVDLPNFNLVIIYMYFNLDIDVDDVLL